MIQIIIKKNIISISDEALKSFERYDWPDNIRELENTIERAVVMAEGEIIERGDLLFSGSSTQAKSEYIQGSYLANIEREEIVKASKRFEANKSRTADYLGINRKTLREKIRRYGIE